MQVVICTENNHIFIVFCPLEEEGMFGINYNVQAETVGVPLKEKVIWGYLWDSTGFSLKLQYVFIPLGGSDTFILSF